MGIKILKRINSFCQSLRLIEIGDAMKTRKWYVLAGSLMLFLGILSCGISYNMGPQATAPVAPGTMVVETITALEAQALTSQAAITATDTLASASSPTNTNTSSAIATVKSPLVISDSLCWLGPGPGYVVSSSILTGTSVVLLGQGSIPGWWIVSDPIYHDPCWIYQQDLQIDPNYDLSNLQTFYPPSTPTPTITLTPIPTLIPTLIPTSSPTALPAP